MTLPRPELSDLLGIQYRRIPVLAIGNDVYCDTSLIASALERRFPKSDGYRTLFPLRKGGGAVDTGMVKALAMYYADRAVFQLASSCLPYDKFPESFMKDRADFIGVPIDAKALAARQPQIKSHLSSHLTLLEEQLADGREWLFDTESPSLADVSLHFIYLWGMYFRGLKDLYDPQTFPKSIAWISRMTKFFQENSDPNAPAFQKMNGIDAAKLIGAASFEGYVWFDKVEAERLGIELGQTVSIAPDDTGKNHHTSGRLLGLNREEFVIEVQGSSGSPSRCHLPRLNFVIKRTNAKL